MTKAASKRPARTCPSLRPSLQQFKKVWRSCSEWDFTFYFFHRDSARLHLKPSTITATELSGSSKPWLELRRRRLWAPPPSKKCVVKCKREFLLEILNIDLQIKTLVGFQFFTAFVFVSQFHLHAIIFTLVWIGLAHCLMIHSRVNFECQFLKNNCSSVSQWANALFVMLFEIIAGGEWGREKKTKKTFSLF